MRLGEVGELENKRANLEELFKEDPAGLCGQDGEILGDISMTQKKYHLVMAIRRQSSHAHCDPPHVKAIVDVVWTAATSRKHNQFISRSLLGTVSLGLGT